MVKKEFTYRGKTLNELSSMSMEEFAAIANARGRRSLKRNFDKALMKRIKKAREMLANGKEPKLIRTHLRDAVVIPQMLGLKFMLHKGNEFQVIEIKPEMLGSYLGEYALTRKKLTHGRAGIGATRSSTAISARK